MDGKTEYEVGVDIPNGENTLFVEVVDVNNQVTKASNFYVGAGDAELPVIELVEPEELKGSKMIIKAKDETELSYITYKWITGYNTDEEQEEEEIRIDLEPGTTETEQEVDIIVFEYLDMKGKINSLNASVAAGICMYEVVRQRSR